MGVTPIQILNNEILIPREYVPQADALEFVLLDDYLVIRPKSANVQAGEDLSPLHSLIGIASTKDPTASARVKEILTEEGFASSPITN